jgi:act minimal PKS chain-length factor (CLF/KS beta)
VTAGVGGGAGGGPAGGEAVVTGLGVIAPNGLTTAAFWAATLAGRTGLRRITRFDPGPYPVTVAGEVTGFDPGAHLSSRLLPQTDHMTRMALVASDQALADAGVRPAELPEFALGVVTASASGGFEFGQRELEKLWSRGAGHVSAYQSFAWFYAVNTGQISIRHGMRGPSGVLVAEQAGGLDAVAQARRQLRTGTELVVTGGVDSSLCPWGLVAQIPSGRLSHDADPATAYRPFAPDASGHVPGEGGAILVLEDRAAAARRGHHDAYGVVAGWSATFDPPPDPPSSSTAGSGGPGRVGGVDGVGDPRSGHHGAFPDPAAASTGASADGLQRAVEGALGDAGIGVGDVDLVLADAAGTPDLDRAEAEALVALFGPRGVAVTAPKTMTGRLASGGAPLDVAVALLALRDQVVPPTVGTTGLAAGCDLDLVLGTPRAAALRTVLVVARGYGGFNSALVVRAPA